MADSKLTDLPEMSVTSLNNDDVLYIAKTSDPVASNKITYANLINTKFNNLSAKHDTLDVNFNGLQTDFDEKMIEFNTLNDSITSYEVPISGFDLVSYNNAGTNQRFTTAFFVPSGLNVRVGDILLPTIRLSGGEETTAMAGISGLTCHANALSSDCNGEFGLGLVQFEALNFTGTHMQIADPRENFPKLFIKIIHRIDA